MVRHRYCRRLLIASVTGRLSLGMLPVALFVTLPTVAKPDRHTAGSTGIIDRALQNDPNNTRVATIC
ncbi:hypothetical protein ACFVYG_32495 [Streptomyces sp. NPDC058256]|uniref:hypothetical protein n=1 Tax=Streptomyces sp. NPDC058256 TaxID=3346408 RepID=UPI0036E95D42